MSLVEKYAVIKYDVDKLFVLTFLIGMFSLFYLEPVMSMYL